MRARPPSAGDPHHVDEHGSAAPASLLRAAPLLAYLAVGERAQTEILVGLARGGIDVAVESHLEERRDLALGSDCARQRSLRLFEAGSNDVAQPGPIGVTSSATRATSGGIFSPSPNRRQSGR